MTENKTFDDLAIIQQIKSSKIENDETYNECSRLQKIKMSSLFLKNYSLKNKGRFH